MNLTIINNNNQMNKFNMYLRGIESSKQALEAYIKRYGYKENLGQHEYSEFRDKVNDCEELSYGEKADLCGRFTSMLNNL